MYVEICVFGAIYSVTRAVLWYYNRVKDHQRFALCDIPGPEPSLFNGNLYELRKSAQLPHDVMDGWLQRYGKVVGYFMGSQRYLLISDLDTLQKIYISGTSVFRNRPNIIVDAKPIIDSLLVIKDDRWKRVRRIIAPTFSHTKVTSPAIANLIESCVDSFMNKLNSHRNSDTDMTLPIEVNIYPIAQAASLDIIAKTALNMNHDVHRDDNVLLNAVRQYFSEAQNIAIELATLLPFLRPLMTFVNNNLTAGKMTDMTVKHIHEQLIEVTKNPIDPKSQTFLHSIISSFSSGNLSKDELIGNAHLILLAGYETSANAVTYTLFMLAKNQDIQDKLRDYFNDHSEHDLDYFEMVWLESLRILPPVTLFLVREASEDVEIDGIRIEKGTVVQAPVWHIHHNEDVWPEPWTFDPERFSPDNKKNLHPMSFLAFGSGPRVCLGMQLADHEARLIIRRMLTTYRVELSDKTPELSFKYSTVFINPSGPVYLKLTAI